MTDLRQSPASDPLLDRLGLSTLLGHEKAFTSAKLKALDAAAQTPGLPPTAYQLMMLLVIKVWPTQGYYRPRVATLARYLGVSEQAVRRASVRLEQASLIHVDRQSGPNGTNRYFLNLSRFQPRTETEVAVSLIEKKPDETYIAGFTESELRFIAGGSDD